MYSSNKFLIVLIASSCCSLAQGRDTSLDQVIVTATRTPTELADFAGSISQILPAEIALVGATHHAELLNRVPGAFFQRNSGQESLTAIRSPVLTGAGSCGAFLFLEDSIPIRPVGFCNVNDLFEVNFGQAGSIEVQRGPASAIYGSSAMHGAVNVISADPTTLPAFGAGLDVGPDSFVRGDVTLARRGNDYAVSLLGNVEYDGGWRDHSTTKQQKINIGYTQRFANSSLAVYLASTNLDQDTAGYSTSYRDRDIARSNANPEAYRNARATRLSAHWQRPLNEQTTLDLRPYVRTSRMEFLQHFLLGKPLENNGQDSVGLITTLQHQFRSGASVLGGIDLEAANISLLESQDLPTTDGAPAANAIRPAGRHYDYDVKSNVIAAYAHFEQPLSATWKATIGVRGEYVAYDYDNHMIAGNTAENGSNPCGINGCLYQRPADRNDSFTSVTPKLGLIWNWQPSHSVFMSAVRGYRAPETTELYRLQRQQTNASLEPEHLDSIEMGARGSISELRYSLAAFDMRRENIISRDSAGFNVSNGKSKHRGVEYEFAWTVIDPLTISAAGTWAKHTYDFTSIADGESIIAGNEIDTAPKHLWNARANWRILATVNTELEWQHVGAYWTDAANLHRYDGHSLINLRGNWAITPQWLVTARLNNITDRAYADRADFAFGNERYFPGRGRTLFMEMRYEYR